MMRLAMMAYEHWDEWLKKEGLMQMVAYEPGRTAAIAPMTLKHELRVLNSASVPPGMISAHVAIAAATRAGAEVDV